MRNKKIRYTFSMPTQNPQELVQTHLPTDKNQTPHHNLSRKLAFTLLFLCVCTIAVALGYLIYRHSSASPTSNSESTQITYNPQFVERKERSLNRAKFDKFFRQINTLHDAPQLLTSAIVSLNFQGTITESAFTNSQIDDHETIYTLKIADNRGHTTQFHLTDEEVSRAYVEQASDTNPIQASLNDLKPGDNITVSLNVDFLDESIHENYTISIQPAR